MLKNASVTLSGGNMEQSERAEAKKLIRLFEERLEKFFSRGELVPRQIRPVMPGDVICAFYHGALLVGYHPNLGTPLHSFLQISGEGPPSAYTFYRFLRDQTGLEFCVVVIRRSILQSPSDLQEREFDAVVAELVRSELARPESTNDMIMTTPLFGPNVYPVQEKLVFILMPFQDDLTDIYLTIIKPIIESHNLVARRADDITSNNAIISDIWKSICESRFIVADTTGLNPNVMYELGIAHTLGKETIIVTQENREQRYPFDISHMRRIGYQNTAVGAGELRERLSGTISHVLGKLTGEVA